MCLPLLIKFLWSGTDALNPREALFDIFVVVLAEQDAELIRRYIVRFHPLDKLGIKRFAFFDVPLYVGLELLAGAVIAVFAGHLADAAVAFLAELAHAVHLSR